MAIQPNDSFDVLRHYIMRAQPPLSDGGQELSRALESLSDRLDTMDRALCSLSEQHV
jgi:hypothetical protein